eukprot:299368-Prorocentrum_minimum.AAC.1
MKLRLWRSSRTVSLAVAGVAACSRKRTVLGRSSALAACSLSRTNAAARARSPSSRHNAAKASSVGTRIEMSCAGGGFT